MANETRIFRIPPNMPVQAVASHVDHYLRANQGLQVQGASHGEEGVLQVLSPLPRSYPGHSLLTEDLGVLLGEDDCPCGRKGKYFKVTGRVPRAEVRGCSDTYEG